MALLYKRRRALAATLCLRACAGHYAPAKSTQAATPIPAGRRDQVVGTYHRAGRGSRRGDARSHFRLPTAVLAVGAQRPCCRPRDAEVLDAAFVFRIRRSAPELRGRESTFSCRRARVLRMRVRRSALGSLRIAFPLAFTMRNSPLSAARRSRADLLELPEVAARAAAQLAPWNRRASRISVSLRRLNDERGLGLRATLNRHTRASAAPGVFRPVRPS